MNKKQLDDKQLASLLRQIETPDDLKESLLRIPDECGLTDEHPQHLPDKSKMDLHRQHNHWWYLSVAAIIACLLGTLAWLTSGTNSKNNSPSVAEVQSDASQSSPLISSLPTDESLNSMESILEARQHLDAIYAEIEIQQLHKRAQQANVAKRRSIHTSIEPNEFESLLAVHAGQALGSFGGDTEMVQQAMVKVQNLYPNSAGAVLATEILSQ